MRPSNLSKDAAWNFLTREGITEFRVLLIEQILTDDGEFPVFMRAPCEAQVEGEISGNCGAELIEVIDVAEDGVELKVRGEIDHGLEEELMMRVVAFAAPLVDIEGVTEVDVFLEDGVPATKAPPIGSPEH